MIEWKHRAWKNRLDRIQNEDRTHRVVKPLVAYSVMIPNADGIHPIFDADLTSKLQKKSLTLAAACETLPLSKQPNNGEQKK